MICQHLSLLVQQCPAFYLMNSHMVPRMLIGALFTLRVSVVLHVSPLKQVLFVGLHVVQTRAGLLISLGCSYFSSLCIQITYSWFDSQIQSTLMSLDHL